MNRLMKRLSIPIITLLAVCLLTAGIVLAGGKDGPKVCHATSSNPGPLPGTEWRSGKVIPAPSENAMAAHLAHGDQEVHFSGAQVGDQCTFLAVIGQ